MLKKYQKLISTVVFLSSLLCIGFVLLLPTNRALADGIDLQAPTASAQGSAGAGTEAGSQLPAFMEQLFDIGMSLGFGAVIISFAAPVYISLGIVYNNTGRREEAIAMFRKALKINPGYATAYFCLSKVCFYEKQYNLAAKYCDKAEGLGFKIPVEFAEQLKEYKDIGLK